MLAVRLLGFPRPAADFAAAEKLYPQMPEKGKPEKGVFAEQASSCVVPPFASGDAPGHPCSDFRVQPGHIFTAKTHLRQIPLYGSVHRWSSVTGRTRCVTFPADVDSLRDVRQRNQWRYRSGRGGKRKNSLHRATSLMSVQPDKSLRLRVALYFVNIFSRRNRGDLFGCLQWLCIFCTSAPDSFKTLWKGLEKIIVKYKLFFLTYFSELMNQK